MTENKKSNFGFFIGLTVALLLPLSFYIIAKVLGKDKLNMPPYYNVESKTSTKDTIYHKVNDIQLVNQMGDKVSLNKDLAGKMLIVEVFFTNCNTICPKLTNNVSYFLHRAFKKNDTTVHFVSISIDPENDDVAALKTYSTQFKVNPDHWWFLTGNRADIYNYIRNELKLKANENGAGADALEHTPTLVLIDKERYVRGYYNGLDTAELRNCAEDVGKISMQKKKRN